MGRALASAALLLVAAAACAPARLATPARDTGPRKVAPPKRLEVVWHQRLTQPAPLEYEPRERAQPAWDGRRGWLWVADRFGVVRSLDASGKERWARDAGSGIEADLVVDRDVLYVITTGGRVHALDAVVGQTRWTYEAGVELATRPALAGGKLLVPSLADTLVALDAATGEFQWFHRRPARAGLSIRGAASVAVSGESVVTGFSDGTVVSLALADGRVRWTRQLVTTKGFTDVDATPVIHEGRVYAATYAGEVTALDLESGEPLWTRPGVPSAVSLARVGRHLVVLGTEGAAALRVLDGGRTWETGYRGGTPSAPAVVDETILVGTEDGPVYGLSARTGRPVVAFAPGNGVAAAPQATADGLWVWSNGGWLYRLAWR